MTLTIFGATGMVGLHVVNQALHMGYKVKAFGRNVYTTDLPDSENLQKVQGALFDKNDVKNAIKGSDAVISVLGGATDGNDKTRSLGMKNIIEQMEKAGVKRIVALGGMGVLLSADNTLLLDNEEYPKQFIPVGLEHLKAYEYLKASTLDWTFVCPPDIINAEVTGIMHTAADHLPEPNNYKITSGDLAFFILNELTKNKYLKKRVGISN
jgi:uncharacterized protein